MQCEITMYTSIPQNVFQKEKCEDGKVKEKYPMAAIIQQFSRE